MNRHPMSSFPAEGSRRLGSSDRYREDRRFGQSVLLSITDRKTQLLRGPA